MDPISIGLLTSLAGGAGGEIGRQVWVALSSLVRRPFSRGSASTESTETGVVQLEALEQAPHDQISAHALSTALAVRAALDTDFAAALRDWTARAQAVAIEDSSIHNTVSGTVHGNTVQGRDFGDITFMSPPPRPPSGPDA